MHSSRKVVGTVLAIGIAAAMVPGFAASLGGVTAGKLGANGAAVSACDTNGFTVSYTNMSGSVTAANLGGIADPGCEGGQLTLTLVNASGTSIGAGGPQLIATDAGTVDNTITVTLSPTPAANLVAAIHVVVTGP